MKLQRSFFLFLGLINFYCLIFLFHGWDFLDYGNLICGVLCFLVVVFDRDK